MKKKSIFIIGIIVSIGFFYYPSIAKGYTCEVNLFDTDKDTYYVDESIIINAEWNLEPNASYDEYFIQIQIYNASYKLLWNSSEYHQTGFNSDVWIVDIRDLDLTLKNNTNSLYVIFNYYISQGGKPENLFLETIEIFTIKRNISCELISFKDYLNFGEVLHFQARFYNTSLNNNSFLTNHIISLKIISNNFVFYKKNYTTNSSGTIEIFVSSYSNLTIGLNLISFTALSNQFFKESYFEFELLIQSPTFEDPKSKNPKKIENSLQLELISLISIISLLVVISLLIYYNNTKRRVRHKNLAEITFKY